MALFVISWTDAPGALEKRLASRQAHLDYIAAHAAMVKLGGPFLDEAGAMTGSLVIVEADDLATAKAFHEADPYARAGLFETSTVQPWRLSVGALG